MAKWNTGAIECKPTDGAHWNNGVLTIDGTPAKDIVQYGIERGFMKRSKEVFTQNDRPIHKRFYLV